MRGSELLRRFEADPHHPAVLVEEVSRRYAPANWGRRHVLFSRLGGIKPGMEHDVLADDDDDDMNDDDDGFDDEIVDDLLLPDDPAKTALEGVSLFVTGGTALALVGPPASGKSVLLRVIAGIAPPDSGRVLTRGLVVPVLLSVQKLFPSELPLRKAIPFMWMILRVPVARPRKRVKEVFELLGDQALAQRRVRFTRGWPIWKRILYAMALVLEPDVLLLDLDLPDGEFGEACRARILELKRNGAAVIVAARDVENVAWIADSVAQMRRGRIVRVESLEAALAAEKESVVS